MALISFTIISSCKKKVDDLVKQVDNVITFSEFPNEVGNHWRYDYKPFNGPTGFIDVDIIGTSSLPGGQAAKIWVYKTLNYTDTNFVVFDGQTATIYRRSNRGSTSPFYRKTHYLFPLQIGNVWVSQLDSIRVFANSTLTVPAGTFENTFELSKRGQGPNIMTRDTIWFTPHTGMTKLKQIEIDLGLVPLNGIWELLEYSLK